jgi:hypothetical protein
MNKKLLLLIPIAGVIGVSLLSTTTSKVEKYHKDGIEAINFSSNPNLGLTGAPGEGNCTQCHTGAATQSAAGNVNLFATTEYIVGTDYTFEIGMGGSTNGFEMTVLDANGNQAGTFTAGTNTSVASQGGKEYIRHSTKTGFWTFHWIAPSSDMGQLTAYYSLNSTNNDGTNQGDTIYLGQHIIGSAVSNGISDYEKQDKKIKMFFNENTREINVRYALNSKARIQVNISDLSGRLVQTSQIGQKGLGIHTETIPLEDLSNEGIYFVSLFINNNVYNRKVYLK